MIVFRVSAALKMYVLASFDDCLLTIQVNVH